MPVNRGSTPTKKYSERDRWEDARNNNAYSDDPPTDFSSLAVAQPLASQQPDAGMSFDPRANTFQIPDASEPPQTDLASFDPQPPASFQPPAPPPAPDDEALKQKLVQDTAPVTNPDDAEPLVQEPAAPTPSSPPPEQTNGLAPWQMALAKRGQSLGLDYSGGDVSKEQAKPEPLKTPEGQGQSSTPAAPPVDDLQRQLGNAQDFEARKALISGIGQAGETIGAAFGHRKANLEAFAPSKVGDDQRKSLENLMALRMKAQMAAKKLGPDGKPLDPDKDGFSEQNIKLQNAFINRYGHEEYFRGLPRQALMVIGGEMAKGRSLEQALSLYGQTQDWKKSEADRSQKNFDTQQSQHREDQMNLLSRKVGTDVATYANKHLDKVAPVVSSLQNIASIMPEFITGGGAGSLPEGFRMENLTTKMLGALPGGVGDWGSDPKQQQIKAAVDDLYQKYIRPLAGANLPKDEKATFDDILHNKIMSDPATAAAVVNMIYKDTYRNLSRKELAFKFGLDLDHHPEAWDALTMSGLFPSTEDSIWDVAKKQTAPTGRTSDAPQPNEQAPEAPPITPKSAVEVTDAQAKAGGLSDAEIEAVKRGEVVKKTHAQAPAPKQVTGTPFKDPAKAKARAIQLGYRPDLPEEQKLAIQKQIASEGL